MGLRRSLPRQLLHSLLRASSLLPGQVAAAAGSSIRPASSLADDDDRGVGRPTTPWVRQVISGVDLMRHPKYNKGLAFSETERDRLYLRGLLPPAVLSQEVQLERTMLNIRSKDSDLEKYTYLTSLQERNERLFYRVLIENFEELLPVVHSPTVRVACQRYGLMFKSLPRGLFITLEDKGRVFRILKNWPERNVKVIVVTDGERVGNLGDLGVQAVGVPISKLSLHTACGGIAPAVCVPVVIDVSCCCPGRCADPGVLLARHRASRSWHWHLALGLALALATQAAPPSAASAACGRQPAPCCAPPPPPSAAQVQRPVGWLPPACPAGPPPPRLPLTPPAGGHGQRGPPAQPLLRGRAAQAGARRRLLRAAGRVPDGGEAQVGGCTRRGAAGRGQGRQGWGGPGRRTDSVLRSLVLIPTWRLPTMASAQHRRAPPPNSPQLLPFSARSHGPAPNLPTPCPASTPTLRRYGNTTLVHFEDLTYENASKVLNMYRTELPCFNDDIQGMAAAVLAGGPATLPAPALPRPALPASTPCWRSALRPLSNAHCWRAAPSPRRPAAQGEQRPRCPLPPCPLPPPLAAPCAHLPLPHTAGLLAALPKTGGSLAQQTILLSGEGPQATCIAELLAAAIASQTNQTVLDTRRRIWLADSRGLVTRERGDSSTLEDYKLPYCHTGARQGGATGPC
jgi:hypothetical protein